MVAPKDERYAAINPKHQTPTLLLEDGEPLVESLAILSHIAARDLGRRLGSLQGTRAFDRLNSVLAFLHTEVHGAFAPAWTAFKLPEDATTEKELLRKLARPGSHRRPRLERHLCRLCQGGHSAPPVCQERQRRSRAGDEPSAIQLTHSRCSRTPYVGCP